MNNPGERNEGTRAAIRKVLSVQRKNLNSGDLSRQAKKTAEDIAKRFPYSDVALKDTPTLQLIHAQMSEDFQYKRLPSRKDLKKAIYIIEMDGESSNDIQKFNRNVITAIEKQILVGKSKSLIRAVLSAYLHTYRKNIFISKQYALLLQKHHYQIHPKWKKIIDTYPLLLNSESGARTLGIYYKNNKISAKNFARKELGLEGILSDCEFHENMVNSASDQIIKDRNSDMISNYVRSFLDWVCYDSGATTDQRREAVFKAILLPFQNKEPSDNLKKRIIKTIEKTVGDIRLSSNSWPIMENSEVSDTCKTVLRRWLAGASLELFFEVIEKAVITSRPDHWEVRRKFWSWYLENGYIQEAWAILGREAQEIMEEDNLNSKITSFAKLDGGQSSHSVIMLRIGDIRLIEVSHEGRLRAFLSPNKKIPKFYQGEYVYSNITRLDNDGVTDNHWIHVKSGSWREDVAEYIQSHTGIRHKILG